MKSHLSSILWIMRRTPGIVMLLMLAAPGVLPAEDLPILPKGLWEYVRTIEGTKPGGKPETLTSKRCSNPSEDWKKQNEMLKTIGCKFSPVKKSGNTYTFSADCRRDNPGGGSVTSTSTTVLTIKSENVYTVKVDVVMNGIKSVENLTATRIGNCE